jgi:phosphatidylglycerophosphatase C
MKNVAIFDFDNTLIKGDSLWPFLIFACGRISTCTAIVEALAWGSFKCVQKRLPDGVRTFVKDFLLHRLLKGKRRDDLKEAAQKTRVWRKLNEPIVNKLCEHHDKGDVIVIASGSLDLYLVEMLRDIPHDALICTNVSVEGGIVTGEMTGGNCVRQVKAVRVKEWLDTHGPFDDSFGYGNAPHDLPMLELVRHKVIVS